MKKVYVDDTNQATIICPRCGFEKNIDVTDFKDTPKSLKAKCKCGETHRFTIEFRKKYRKNVRLPGEYIAKENREKEEIIIRELSLTGIRFESLKSHQISLDDILEVKFKLDNPLKSEIRKLVKVIWIKDRIVGAHYTETKFYEKDLGFYMIHN
jgi:PilZ domain